jgi:hypothetical protein
MKIRLISVRRAKIEKNRSFMKAEDMDKISDDEMRDCPSHLDMSTLGILT